jgi:hypothetical protein
MLDIHRHKSGALNLWRDDLRVVPNFWDGTEPVPPSNLRLRNEPAAPLFLPPSKCGCSSVVEHLLAKEDVASSSLVTRSSLRLNMAKAKAGASRALEFRRVFCICSTRNRSCLRAVSKIRFRQSFLKASSAATRLRFSVSLCGRSVCEMRTK